MRAGFPLLGLLLSATACAAPDRTEQGSAGSASGVSPTAGEEGDTVDDGNGDGNDDGNADDGAKLDVADGEDGGPGDCEGQGEGDVEFSYLWAANSSEGTVSKINTVTMEEEGRYLASSTEFPSPSRTSVGLSGNVAVANRTENSGVTMIVADLEECTDHNGEPGIQTSIGKTDVLEWGRDDCVGWHVPLGTGMLRPVAWSAGTFLETSCEWTDQEVWTVGARQGQNGSVRVWVLDGDNGDILDEVAVPELPVGSYGPYGGAFDPDGDFWFADSGNDGNGRALVRMRGDDHSYDLWDTPPDFAAYGFTLDTKGRPWIVSSHRGGLIRFDPQTETYDRVEDQLGIGIQEDANGLVWIVNYPYTWRGVRAYDRDTMAFVREIEIPTGFNNRGLSFDFFGKIMVVGSKSVYRVDPDTGEIDSYDGLDGAYTYSDMTGWGLKNVTFPPQG